MKKLYNNIKEYNSVNLLFIIVLGSALAFMLYTIIFNAGDKTNMWFYPFIGVYGQEDFYNHVQFTNDLSTLYSNSRGDTLCFPPLAYLMYKALFNLGNTQDIYGLFESEKYFDMPLHKHVYVYYNLIVLLLWIIGIAIANKDRNGSKLNILLTLTIAFSVEFYGTGVLIGNSSLLVCGMLLIAINLRESDNKVYREIALVLIALATGLKLYPAIFGILYIFEKRWKEAIRLIVYGVITVFLPFIFLGGLEGLKNYVSILTLVNNSDTYGFITNIQDLVGTIIRIFTDGDFKTLCKIIGVAFLGCQIILAFISKNKYIRLYFISSTLVLILSKSYRYTAIYLVVPLILYIQDNYKRIKFKNTEITVLMILSGIGLAIPIIPGILSNFGIYLTIEKAWGNIQILSIDIVVYSSIWLINLILTIHTLKDCIELREKDKNKLGLSK